MNSEEFKGYIDAGNSYKMDMGKYLSKAFDLTKEHFGKWVLINLVFMLISMLMAITIIGIFFLPVFGYGYLHITQKAYNNQEFEVGDLFWGFKEHFGKLFTIGLLYMLGGILIAIPIFVAYGVLGFFTGDIENLDSGGIALLGVAYLLTLILSLTYQTLFVFAPHFGVYANCSIGESFKYSMNFVKKNFWWWLLLIFVASFLGAIGVIACYVGILLTLHFQQLTIAIGFFEFLNPGAVEEAIDDIH